MLQRRSQMEGSFGQPSDRNEIDPKQIAPTSAMKEPPPTDVLMNGPSLSQMLLNEVYEVMQVCFLQQTFSFSDSIGLQIWH